MRYEFDLCLHIIRKVTPGMALDIGPGKSPFPRMARENGWDVYGIDPSADQIGDIKIYRGYFPDIPKELEGKKYELVFSSECIYYWPRIDQAFQTLKDILHPGGYLLIKSRQGNSYKGGIIANANWIPTKEKLEKMLDKYHFKVKYFKSHPDNFFNRISKRKSSSHVGAILEKIYVTLFGIDNAHCFVVLAANE